MAVTSAVPVFGKEGAPFFPGFRLLDVEAGGVRFAGVIGGSGPPLLLIHGYPETHIAWRKVAGRLAREFTVIAPDLPGYGASRVAPEGPRWTKRRVGEALVLLMRTLGHKRFAVVGHDRGARAGYRLVLDHPGIAMAFAALSVVPTLDALENVDYTFAHKNYHWFLLSQPNALPELLLSAAPDAVLDWEFEVINAADDSVIEPAARAAYREAFRNPAVRHTMCEDYRAALTEDLECDRVDRANGREIDCPVLALWPTYQSVKKPFPDEIWRRWAGSVVGATTTGDHLQPEDRPAEVLAALVPFLQQHL
ncbi:MAG: alpha/beta hydrolase [Sphingobium sp.]|nr:alpha/beta hydrolase [Sphingobium sp.]